MKTLKKKNKQDLATLLKTARIRSGYSQKEISIILGYKTPQFISNWERGLSTPPGKILYKLGEMYKISPEKLYEAILEVTLKKVEADLKKDFLASSSRSNLKKTSF